MPLLSFFYTSQSPDNAALTAVGIKFNEHLVSDEHLDAVQTHLAREVAEYPLPILKYDSKQGIRQGLFYGALYLWRLVLH